MFKTVRSTVAEFLRRHRRGALALREKLRPNEDAFNLVLAGFVGIVGGGINVLYNFLQEASKWLVLDKSGDLSEIARGLTNWQRVITPTLGGITAGLILFIGLRIAGKHGSSNLLEVVVAGDGRLRMRDALIKGFSSLVSIISGASIGREGLVTQLSATIASKWGQFKNWQPYRLRLLVACGASAGISAAYNAPLAGAVFAAQIVLGNFSMNLFAPVVFSSVVATVVCRSSMEIVHWPTVSVFEFNRLSQLPWFLVLGLACGIFGAVFLKLLKASEWLFSKLPVPFPFRLGLAGLMVGVLAIWWPDIWGNGFGPANVILEGKYEFTVMFLLGLTLAKLLATVATVGAGTVGGVMTPTLFLGAALGSTLGGSLHEFGVGMELDVGIFALVGMGAMLAATTHSVLLAMIMVFELSLNYSLMPPLMLACAVAALISRQLNAYSVYTEPVAEKSTLVDRESEAVGAATRTTVADIMLEPVPALAENTLFSEIAERFLRSANNYLPVVNSVGRLVGMVALQDLKEYLQMGDTFNAVIAGDIMRPVSAMLTPNQTIISVLPKLLEAEIRNMPVVNNMNERRLIGRLVRAEALGMLSEAIATGHGHGK